MYRSKPYTALIILSVSYVVKKGFWGLQWKDNGMLIDFKHPLVLKFWKNRSIAKKRRFDYTGDVAEPTEKSRNKTTTLQRMKKQTKTRQLKISKNVI